MSHAAEDEELPAADWWSQFIGWMLRPRIFGTFVLAALFVVVIPAFPNIWPAVSQREKFQMSVERIDLTPATRWTPHGIVAQVAKSHPDWAERSLLDADLAAEVASAFAKHPWIAKVDRVEKTRQGRVVVDVTYRTPVAMVETHRGLYPIDARGVLLPPNDFSLAQSSQLPHLREIRSMPNGSPGAPWGDPLVVAGAKLCAALTPKGTLDTHWERYGLEAVLAPPSPLESTEVEPAPPVFQLLTKGGRHILWGRPPGDDSLEPSVKQKLGRLDEYIRQMKSLDLPEGKKYMEIRDFQSIYLLSELPGEGTLR